MENTCTGEVQTHQRESDIEFLIIFKTQIFNNYLKKKNFNIKYKNLKPFFTFYHFLDIFLSMIIFNFFHHFKSKTFLFF